MRRKKKEESGVRPDKRICLRCRKKFESRGIHNRLCQPCSTAIGKQGEGISIYTVRPRWVEELVC